MKRVVITGQGAICALGHNANDVMTAMREGECGIGPIDIRDVDRLSIKIGGQVKGFSPEEHYTRQQIGLYDRFTQFALIAAKRQSNSRALYSTANWR